MSLVIAAFDSTHGFLCSEGRTVSRDRYGKPRIEREDAFKHIQINESLAIAATGATEFAVRALAAARDIGECFSSRCADLDGGMVDLFTRLVKQIPDKLPDCPVPLAIVILSKNSLTRRVTCALLVSGCDPQRFGPPPDSEVHTVITAPRRETNDLIEHRMDAVLPEIFKETHNANFRAKIEAAVKLAVADAAKSDEEINANVQFAFIL
jgi:hypothetical protein